MGPAFALGAVALTLLAAQLTDRGADRSELALVNGEPISRSSFEAYSLVFRRPDGSLRVGNDDILMSLVNQELVHQEASRLGIRVSDVEVTALLESAESLDLDPESLEREGGTDAYRARLRGFIEMDRVKARVTRVKVDDIEVRAAFAALTSTSVDYDQVAPSIRARLEFERREASWRAWLAQRRACSSILLLDGAFSLPSPDPAVRCLDL